LPELVQIFDDMISEDPDARPSMAQACKRLEDVTLELSEDIRKTSAWEYHPAKFSG